MNPTALNKRDLEMGCSFVFSSLTLFLARLNLDL
jgi:hypothetical protein